jgi:hypothetical protein
MTDVRLESALARLAPHVDDVPAWDDVVRRARTGSRPPWKLAAVVVAVLVTGGLVAGALAEGLLNGSLDRLSAWVGDQPGEPAPEQQAVFDRENRASYAHFPSGTRVGRLLNFELRGRRHDLLGFRDGQNLCLRILPSVFPHATAVPECVPQQQLVRLGKPVAIIGGYIGVGDPGVTILYGLAADTVQRIDVRMDDEVLGPATVSNNAFLIALADDRDRTVEWPTVVLRASGANGSADFQMRTGPMFPSGSPEDLPGPDHVERVLDSGSIGWLERGEPRGEPFRWPYGEPKRIIHSRMLTPDPESSFRLAIAYGEDDDWRANGRWYCLAWLWPLIPDSWSRGCARADTIDSGLMMEGAWPSAGQEFPHWVGLASDQVARIEIFYRDGSIQPVRLNNNVFSFYVAADQESKLVAYDQQGRVVRIMMLGGLER